MKYILLLIVVLPIYGCGGGSSSSEESESEVIVTINLGSLPDQLTMNSDGIEGNLELHISIDFDINENGEFDEGDVSFRLQEWDSNYPPNTVVQLKDLDAYYWNYTDTNEVTRGSEITFKLDANSVTFSAESPNNQLVSQITDTTQVNVKVRFNTVEISCQDYLPSVDEYTQVMSNSELLDDKLDFIGSSESCDIDTVLIAVR